MADKESKATSATSIRMDEETSQKFRDLASGFPNQSAAMAKMIEAYEFQKGKAILTEKRGDIEQFEKYVNALTRMFMGSLEDNQNITETVRTEFDASLKSKDATIQDLQEKLTTANQIKEDATAKAKNFADENVRLNSQIATMEREYATKFDDMQKSLKDKTDLTQTLKESCMELRHKVEGMLQEHEQFAVVSSELEALRRTQELTERNLGEVKKQLDRENKEHEKALAEQKQHEIDVLERLREHSQLTMEKAILELQKEHQEQLDNVKRDIEKLKEQKQAEIDKYQQRYFELLEKMKNQSTEVVERESDLS